MAKTIGYSLDFTVTVDHPEKRDASYRVRKSYSVADSRFSESFASAINGYAALLRGEDDFASEYVSRVVVWAITSNGTRGRKVRKTVRRYRATDGTIYDTFTPEREEAMRAAEVRDYSEKQAA